MKEKSKVVADFSFILRHLSFRYIIQYWRRWCVDRTDAGLEVAERSDWRGVSM